MRYFVRIGDEEHEVLLDGDGVHIDGADVAAQVTAIDGTPVRMVTIGDEVHRVVFVRARVAGSTRSGSTAIASTSRRSTSERARFESWPASRRGRADRRRSSRRCPG